MQQSTCTVPENGAVCGSRNVAKGMCDKHYRRAKKHGSPHLGALPVYANDLERFLAKVDRGEPDECWPWRARVHPNGYGIFYLDQRFEYAHRAAYALFVGPIPDGLTIDHVRANGCSRRDCVNWLRHLEPVTQQVNTLRGDGPSARQARQTHCLSGHPFDAVNTYVHNNHRYCKQCRSEYRAGVMQHADSD